MKHIICPICLEYTDEINHNRVFCQDIGGNVKISHRFEYGNDDDFFILIILKKKHILRLDSKWNNNKYVIRYNRHIIPLSPFQYCESLDIMNKFLKNKAFS